MQLAEHQPVYGTIVAAKRKFSLSAVFIYGKEPRWEWMLSHREYSVGRRTYAMIASGTYSRGQISLRQGLLSVDTLSRVHLWLQKETT